MVQRSILAGVQVHNGAFLAAASPTDDELRDIAAVQVMDPIVSSVQLDQ